jgi:hypothetical protein
VTGRTDAEESDLDATLRAPSPTFETQRPAAVEEEEGMVGGAETLTPAPAPLAVELSSSSAGRSAAGRSAAGAEPPTPGAMSKAGLLAAQRVSATQKHAKLEEEIKKASERRRADKAGRADAAFTKTFSSVMEGIEGKGLLAEMDVILAQTVAAKAKKSKDLHAEWDELVFQQIQRQILTYVDALDPAELTARLAVPYDAYLETVNAKQDKNDKSGVFRDIVLVYDYNPFDNFRGFKYKTNWLDDPTQRDVYKSIREQLAIGLLKRVANRGGRETLDRSFWDKLEATPYGRFTDAMGDMRAQRVNEHSHKRGTSSLVMDHYNVPTGGAVPNAEFTALNGAGKGLPAETGHRAGRADMHELVNHRIEHATSSVTGGDTWLEYKGKRECAVPGLSKERKDLFDVVNMCSDPADARPQGDQWLSAKGKMTVLPPSVINSDRKSLFGTIQQSGPVFARVKPDQTCGDLWLDHKGKAAVPGIMPSGSEGGLYTVLMQTEQQK